jgi:hypothetical protein
MFAEEGGWRPRTILIEDALNPSCDAEAELEDRDGRPTAVATRLQKVQGVEGGLGDIEPRLQIQCEGALGDMDKEEEDYAILDRRKRMPSMSEKSRVEEVLPRGRRLGLDARQA